MKTFKKVYIEITNICNLKCDFCPKTKRKEALTREDQFMHILKEVKPYTDHIYLHLLGEPTMHPQLQSYLRLSNEAGLKVNLTTNGTLLHQVEDILIQAPALRQVNISLHSFESNEAKMTMEDYISQITRFTNRITQQSQTIVSLRLWNIDSEELKGNNTYNERIIQQLQQELEIPFDMLAALGEKAGIKLKQQVYLNRAERFEWPSEEKAKENQEVFCYGLRDQIGILVDGTVVPCCLDNEGTISLGNIFEEKLANIIVSEKSQRIYQGFSNRRATEKLCKGCQYASRH